MKTWFAIAAALATIALIGVVVVKVANRYYLANSTPEERAANGQHWADEEKAMELYVEQQRQQEKMAQRPVNVIITPNVTIEAGNR